MRIPLYQVDVFADRLFAGNPAAVCPLERWLPDVTLQAIAAENNLSETAFFVAEPPGGDADFLLRWFTPATEVELCGHATLASGWAVYERLGWTRPVVRFRTLKAGLLRVERRQDAFWLDLPRRRPEPQPAVPEALARALGAQPVALLAQGSNWLVVYESARTIEGLKPDFAALRALPALGFCVTAPGSRGSEDFVSRYFAPAAGIDEDPVTGSAHCLLVPYWAQRLEREVLEARQASARGGRLRCRLEGERVWLSGGLQPYLNGEIEIPV